jgi:hypothetical protein
MDYKICHPQKIELFKPHTSRTILKHGLVNQLNSFFGMILFAKENNKSLLVPDFTSTLAKSNRSGGHRLKFEKILNKLQLTHALARHGIKLKFEGTHSDKVSFEDGEAMLRKYQKLKQTNKLPVNWKLIEKGFYMNLKPAINSKWGELLEKYQNKLNGNYGAIHPRIELDWRIYCKKPHRKDRATPSLKTTLDRIATKKDLDNNLNIFVSVGLDISKEDAQELNKHNLITLDERVSYKKHGSLSYTEISLLSLFLCKDAKWFVGCSGSTFSRLISKYRIYNNRGTTWYDNKINDLKLIEHGAIPSNQANAKDTVGFFW